MLFFGLDEFVLQFCLKPWPLSPLHTKTLAWNVCFHKRKVDSNMCICLMNTYKDLSWVSKLRFTLSTYKRGNIGTAFNGTMLASCYLSLFDVLLLFQPLCLWVNKGCSFRRILLCYLLCRYFPADDVC